MLKAMLAAAMSAASFVAVPLAAAQSITIEVIESGLYRAERTETIVDQSAVSGTRNAIRNVVFYEHTARVPAVVGTRFGFRFRARGIGADEEVLLTKITHFPPPGLTNPRTGRVQASNVSRLVLRGDSPSYTGYGLDEPWEAAPGEWRMELWHGERKVYEQRYTLFR
jgi:uncharacterized protein DUF3859